MITTVEQFKEVVEGDYKITDLKAYNEYKADLWKRKATKEEVERMSPDNVDSCSFWEYIEKNPELAKDAIGFGITKEQSIADVNRGNFGLACDCGTLSYVWKYKDVANLPILDIGAGYGMLKEFVQTYTKLQYNGVDVYPKIEGVHKVAPDGFTLPSPINSMQFGLVIATNVFQHLSVNQRRGYYAQIGKLLIPSWGIFSVSQVVSMPGRDNGFKCKDDPTKNYMVHYGQFTEIQSLPEIMDDLSKHFQVLTITQRLHDQSFTFHCVAKPQQIMPLVVGAVANPAKN